MHSKIRRILLAFLTVVMLLSAGLGLGPLREMRVRYDLTNEPVRGLSPQIALATQVLGWGRGIIIDVIWIRLEALKQKGRFFELIQLADWACKLNPRVPAVWDFQAWNMAYNVSCMVDYLPDRWAWVRSGIELLRDEAIEWNPEAFELYYSLAWTIFHKVGEQDDNAHMFYKATFAMMMHEVIGDSGLPETLQSFADAPRTREALLRDPGVARLLADCEAVAGDFDLVDDYFDYVFDVAVVTEPLRAVIERPENAAALQAVDTFARNRRLRDEFRMDPALMLDLREKYGPFDWRTPYAHSVYWAEYGLRRLDEFEERLYATAEEFGRDVPTKELEPGLIKSYGPQEQKLYEWHRVQFRRVIYYSLQSLVSRGRLLIDTKGRLLYESGSDYRFADALMPIYEAADEDVHDRFARGVENAYSTFLGNGVAEFHFMGDNKKAREYYEKLRERFPDKVHQDTFEEFLEWRISDYTSSMTFAQIRNFVRGKLTQAYFYLGCGEDEAAAMLEREADYVARTSEPDETNLRGLIRFRQIRESVLVDILDGRVRMPPEVLEHLKGRLADWLGEETYTNLMANVEALEEDGTVAREEVGEDLMKDNTMKPDLDRMY